MKKRRGLLRKLTIFFFIMVLSVSILAGLTTYVFQTNVYHDECEHDLQNLVKLLSELMASDGKEFMAYQEMTLEVGDKVKIPLDYDGDYRPAKALFYKRFNEIYPGKALGVDVDYEDFNEELKILYVTYKQEYWLHAYEVCKNNFGAVYTYYVVPTGENLHMYYVIDAVREPTVIDGEDVIYLNLDVYQDMEVHEHMWKTWESGAVVPGYDTYDNEFGKTYACYYPLIIDGRKLGIVCADMEIEKVNKTILDKSIRQSLSMLILVTILGVILSVLIGKRYVQRLIKLRADVGEFSKNKDVALARKIKNEINGNDEITDLANEIADMIVELSTYMKSILDKNKELTQAQEKIKAANELANKDALTGIRNKTAYDSEVKKIEYNMIREHFDKFGIAMVDLNFLKVINDTYGHEKGNLAIKKICMIICKNFAHSPVFRIGGDEFVVVLENSDYDEAKELVAKFKNTIDEINKDDSLEPWEKVSAAIGWTLFDPEKDDDVQSVFKRADYEMYENKKAMNAERK